mmetsp:Transcript_19634/g.58165  ORF Transcript_19634/g.58165 Transcript_19634/m.58165 type:complete len:109 (+) Transcript_19634:2559-2885(+)
MYAPRSRRAYKLASICLLPEDICFRLIRVAGPDLLSGTALEYCAEHFLVHLDDKNADIQKAIFRTLEVLVAHNPSVVDVLSKKLCPIGTSHRDLRLVGRLLPRHSPYG